MRLGCVRGVEEECMFGASRRGLMGGPPLGDFSEETHFCLGAKYSA